MLKKEKLLSNFRGIYAAKLKNKITVLSQHPISQTPQHKIKEKPIDYGKYSVLTLFRRCNFQQLNNDHSTEIVSWKHMEATNKISVVQNWAIKVKPRNMHVDQVQQWSNLVNLQGAMCFMTVKCGLVYGAWFWVIWLELGWYWVKRIWQCFLQSLIIILY